MNLSERQVTLLKAIIKEHIESTDAVGSQSLVEKYKLRVSPATVRNEMVELIKMGFLQMPHTSSGRIPTTMGFRFYVESLVEDIEMPILQEVALKQKLWPLRFEFEKMLRQASLALADISKKLAIATTYDGHLFSAGAVNILEEPEFWDIDAAKSALALLDNHELLHTIFEKSRVDRDVKIIIGEEMGVPNLSSCCLVFSKYVAGRREGVIAVIGPSRMRYEEVLPAVRCAKSLIEELGATW